HRLGGLLQGGLRGAQRRHRLSRGLIRDTDQQHGCDHSCAAKAHAREGHGRLHEKSAWAGSWVGPRFTRPMVLVGANDDEFMATAGGSAGRPQRGASCSISALAAAAMPSPAPTLNWLMATKTPTPRVGANAA